MNERSQQEVEVTMRSTNNSQFSITGSRPVDVDFLLYASDAATYAIFEQIKEIGCPLLKTFDCRPLELINMSSRGRPLRDVGNSTSSYSLGSLKPGTYFVFFWTFSTIGTILLNSG